MLDAAVERRIEIDRSRAILTEQVHALDADRSKLAADLDVQLAKVRSLESANREIGAPSRCGDGEHPPRARVQP